MLQRACQSLQNYLRQLILWQLGIHLHRLGLKISNSWKKCSGIISRCISGRVEHFEENKKIFGPESEMQHVLALCLYVFRTGTVFSWKVSILLLTAAGLSSKFSLWSSLPLISLGSSLRWIILNSDRVIMSFKG